MSDRPKVTTVIERPGRPTVETTADEPDETVIEWLQKRAGDAERDLAAERATVGRLREALELYADPLSWVGISMLTDPLCGDMADDFDETDIGLRPGKRARAALAASPSPAVPATTSEPTEGDVFDTTPSAGESKPVARAGAQEPGAFTGTPGVPALDAGVVEACARACDRDSHPTSQACAAVLRALIPKETNGAR